MKLVSNVILLLVLSIFPNARPTHSKEANDLSNISDFMEEAVGTLANAIDDVGNKTTATLPPPTERPVEDELTEGSDITSVVPSVTTDANTNVPSGYSSFVPTAQPSTTSGTNDTTTEPNDQPTSTTNAVEVEDDSKSLINTLVPVCAVVAVAFLALFVYKQVKNTSAPDAKLINDEEQPALEDEKKKSVSSTQLDVKNDDVGGAGNISKESVGVATIGLGDNLGVSGASNVIAGQSGQLALGSTSSSSELVVASSRAAAVVPERNYQLSSVKNEDGVVVGSNGLITSLREAVQPKHFLGVSGASNVIAGQSCQLALGSTSSSSNQLVVRSSRELAVRQRNDLKKDDDQEKEEYERANLQSFN